MLVGRKVVESGSCSKVRAVLTLRDEEAFDCIDPFPLRCQLLRRRQEACARRVSNFAAGMD